MSDKKVTVVQEGYGPRLTRRVSIEELQQLDPSWTVKGSPKEIAELSEEADISPDKDMAEKAAKGFEKRARNPTSSKAVFEELAKDIREENGIEGSESSDPLTWRKDESHKEYNKRMKKQYLAESDELSHSPEGESKSDKIARLKAARDAFKNRGKIGESADEWGEIAKDIDEEIEALESGSTTTSELSESEDSDNVRVLDSGDTTVYKVDNFAEIQSENEKTMQVLRDYADSSDNLKIEQDTGEFLWATTNRLEEAREEVGL